jgi:hypothetical protein
MYPGPEINKKTPDKKIAGGFLAEFDIFLSLTVEQEKYSIARLSKNPQMGHKNFGWRLGDLLIIETRFMAADRFSCWF